MSSIVAYTDGAVTKAGVGGWAYVIPDLGVEKAAAVTPATNNTMELQAAIELLSDYRKADLIVYSDSQYLVNGANSWVYGWAANGWLASSGLPVANRDHWEAIARLKEGRVVQFRWVKGHAQNEGNIRADQLAASICRPKAVWGTHRHKTSGALYLSVRQQKCIGPGGEKMAILQSEDGVWRVIPHHLFKKEFEKIGAPDVAEETVGAGVLVDS